VLVESLTRRQIAGRIAAAGGSVLAFPALANTPPAPPDLATGPIEPELEDTQLGTARSVFEHVLAPVTINGQGPFSFIVDTGANTSCVSQGLAKKLNLPRGRPLNVNTIVGRRSRPSVLIDRLDVGARARRRVEAPILPLVEVDGVLGVDWLKGQRLVLGFADKTLEITKSRRESGNEGRVIVPARRKSGQLTIVDAELSGNNISAMIDSGAQFSLGNSALRALVERLDPTARSRATRVGLLTIAGEAFDGDQLALPFMRLGGLTLGNVPVVFADMPIFRLWDLHETPTIMLGIDLLTQFTSVAVDFGRSSVRFDFVGA
jgi:predicted aspartyl protease